MYFIVSCEPSVPYIVWDSGMPVIISAPRYEIGGEKGRGVVRSCWGQERINEVN